MGASLIRCKNSPVQLHPPPNRGPPAGAKFVSLVAFRSQLRTHIESCMRLVSHRHLSRHAADFPPLCLASLPDREGLGLFLVAKGLAYLWLQQVRSMKKPVAEAVLSAMSNSGQAADHNSPALISTSSHGGEFTGKVSF